jgi:hypothetical protein
MRAARRVVSNRVGIVATATTDAARFGYAALPRKFTIQWQAIARSAFMPNRFARLVRLGERVMSRQRCGPIRGEHDNQKDCEDRCRAVGNQSALTLKYE